MSSAGLQARLTRSKVSGSDKHLNYRTVIIHPSAYIQRESWLSVGWKLLQEGAPHERDYLMIIHPSAYVQRESWLFVGWKLLQEGAPHERDYLMIIHPSAYVQRESWLSVGWKLLQEGAPHERDYLLPAPTNKLPGLQSQRAEVCNGLRGADTYHFYGYLPRIEDFWKFHGALLHAPQRPQLHAIGGSSVGFRQS